MSTDDRIVEISANKAFSMNCIFRRTAQLYLILMLASSNTVHGAEISQSMPAEYQAIKIVVSRLAAANNLGTNPLLFTVVPGTYAAALAESLRLCEKENCNYYAQINPFKNYGAQTKEILRQSYLYGNIEAWAHPQGTIELTLQAIRIYGSNQGFLACTLAHEISHVISNSSFQQSELISTRSVGVTEEAKKLITAEVSREFEVMADKEALNMAVRSGYPIDTCLKGLEFLHRVSGDGSKTEPDSTHPGVEERVSALESYAASSEFQQVSRKSDSTLGRWEYDPGMNFLKFIPARSQE